MAFGLLFAGEGLAAFTGVELFDNFFVLDCLPFADLGVSTTLLGPGVAASGTTGVESASNGMAFGLFFLGEGLAAFTGVVLLVDVFAPDFLPFADLGVSTMVLGPGVATSAFAGEGFLELPGDFLADCGDFARDFDGLAGDSSCIGEP